MDRSKYHIGVFGMMLFYTAWVLIPLSQMAYYARDLVLKARGLLVAPGTPVRVGVTDVVVICALSIALLPFYLINWLGGKCQDEALRRNPDLVRDWEVCYGPSPSPGKATNRANKGGNDVSTEK